jgi:Zn finger protein HypA/HybF involved in hydrogenase expression
MTLTRDKLLEIAHAVVTTSEIEIGCDDCLAEIDSLAELQLAGKEVPEALRLIGEHIARCPECAEELTALRAGLSVLVE